ncbi:MAG: transposase [Ardenticatenaceae bacterium]|nr:transposase [Ardenticatenaceae bacterium]MCB9432624.1 transposase [Ardenticatenaceae bacterium]MCB9434054.1 transposase [Ardenticatenaceae bacterium]
MKALLVKKCEKFDYITDLRRFLLKHPLLVLELGFHPVPDNAQPYGFDVEKTVPCDRWLRHKQQMMDNTLLQALFRATVHDLQAEIPGLGDTPVIDTKHIYAWVKENNPREYVTNRYDPEKQPSGDPDCRLGVKRSQNQDDESEKQTKVKKEYLWGYGTGIMAATHPQYGDVVLAEYTLPFNEADSTYFAPLYARLVETIGFRPRFFAADAAFDAWHIYQPFAEEGGLAAIPLNLRGHPQPKLGASGFHLCSQGLEMVPSYEYNHSNGYRAQLLRCPKLFPTKTAEICTHEQFAKGIGCIKHINIEAGGWMRVQINRQSETYKQLYKQRTAAERINSQAKEYGIERPKVRTGHSVVNLNTLTYIVINARALQRVRNSKSQARDP